MQRITITSTRYHTRYHTFCRSLTLVGHNAMYYHNFTVLPHTIPYTFTQFIMVLWLFETRYRQIYKKNVY